MPDRFVLQPNGLLGRFSTIVDNFTHMDMTKEEAVDVAREHMGKLEAEQKVDRGIRDEHPDGKHGSGSYRWEQSLRIVEMQHGKKERARVEKLGSAKRTPKKARRS